jgi:hypothetical protein
MFRAYSGTIGRVFRVLTGACEHFAKSDLQMPQSTGENFNVGSVESFPAFLFPESYE